MPLFGTPLDGRLSLKVGKLGGQIPGLRRPQIGGLGTYGTLDIYPRARVLGEIKFWGVQNDPIFGPDLTPLAEVGYLGQNKVNAPQISQVPCIKWVQKWPENGSKTGHFGPPETAKKAATGHNFYAVANHF